MADTRIETICVPRSTPRARKSTRISENQALEALFEFSHVKVHPSSDLQPSQFHVRQPWGLVTVPDFPRHFSIPPSAGFRSGCPFGSDNPVVRPRIMPAVWVGVESRSGCGSDHEQGKVHEPIRAVPARGDGEPRSHRRSRDSRVPRIRSSCCSCPSRLLSLSSATKRTLARHRRRTIAGRGRQLRLPRIAAHSDGQRQERRRPPMVHACSDRGRREFPRKTRVSVEDASRGLGSQARDGIACLTSAAGVP
ncbi:MAG: hypothetical protein RLY70_1537 [Planctomycetota bacterium]|jgi:hypothetical protein